MNIVSGSILDYLLLTLFAIISLSLSLYLYYNNELTKFTKAVLITLRTVSLFLILSLLLNPFIEYYKSVSNKPPNIVLVDKSLSTNISQNDSAIRNAVKELTESGNDFKIYTFGSNLIQEVSESTNDSTVNNKYSTNLAATLESIKDLNFEKINSVSIISDGIINDGNNLLLAARNLKAPFNYKLIGDTAQRKDLVLSRVLYNKNQFVNSKSKIFVVINSYNIDKEIKINLYENDIKVRSNSVFVSSSGSEYESVFDISSSVEGIKKYKLEIEPEQGEVTNINNNDLFYINYVNNEINMLVIAGAPSYDLSALKQTLSRSENIKYDTRIQKTANEYYEGTLPKFDDYDVILLIGYPNTLSGKESIDIIKREVQKSGNALLFFNSSDISFEKLNELKDLLPFSYNDVGKKEIKSSVLFTPINLYKDIESLRKLNSLPASFFYQGAFSGKPNSTILGLQNSEPAVITDNNSGIKTAAFLGYGFYAWNLKPNGTYEYLQNIVSGFISLCVDENTKDKFTIKTSKDCYAVSEPVYFTSVLKEIDAANKYSVKINVSTREKTFGLELSQTGENIFAGDMKFFEFGDYVVKADLYENELLRYSSTTKFSIDEPFKEYRETKAKDDILNEVANITGGVNLSEKSTAETEEIFKSKDGTSFEYTSKSLFRNSIWYLILILILLSIEWYIRKRNNLA